MTNPGSVTTREVVTMMKRDATWYSSEAAFMREPGRVHRSNCVLDTAKLQHTGIHMSEVHDALGQALRDWVPA